MFGPKKTPLVIVNCQEDWVKLNVIKPYLFKTFKNPILVNLLNPIKPDAIQTQIATHKPDFALIFNTSLLVFQNRLHFLTDLSIPIYSIWFESPRLFWPLIKDLIDNDHHHLLCTHPETLTQVFPKNQTHTVSPFPYFKQTQPKHPPKREAFIFYQFFLSSWFTYDLYKTWDFEAFVVSQQPQATPRPVPRSLEEMLVSLDARQKTAAINLQSLVSKQGHFSLDMSTLDSPHLEDAPINRIDTPLSSEKFSTLLDHYQFVVCLPGIDVTISQEMVECLAAGRVLIAPHNPNQSEFVHEKNCLLYHDIQEIPGLITHYKTQDTTRSKLAQAAAQTGQSCFSPHSFVKQLGSIVS